MKARIERNRHPFRTCFQRCVIALAASCLASLAIASEDAGTVVFTTGAALVDGKPAAEGAIVHSGEVLKTGVNGYVYVKTVDNGFFILRPASEAQISAYHADADQPANSRFKIELRQGVARSVSGAAVKNARQNFRFNTPVAAIGVRGTDFTVQTDDQTTRVAVASGGVVVSGFGAGCTADGGGPCEGPNVRELFAAQSDYVVEVNRKQSSPQLLRDPRLKPDTIVPPRGDEPATTPKASASSDANLAPLKQAQIDGAVSAARHKPLPEPAVGPAAVLWGRWQPLIDRAAELDVDKLATTYQLVGVNQYFALLNYRDRPFSAPQTGQYAFALQGAQAVLQSVTGVPALAGIENGRLSVDFGTSRFSTGFDLVAQGQRYALQAEGGVSASGFSNPSQFLGSTMIVNGVLGSAANGSMVAGYLFNSRLNDGLSASGVTFWSR